ncbi:MAG TPA: GTP-binding protein [Thermomicrobiales bacterium]|nr:GTP-binding protein [Thermomicrobiales bacterium]
MADSHAPPEAIDLLRVATAGSVDDGKSTLIGRLLYETRAVFADQLAEARRASRRQGDDLNLALLTDGLRAEREQGITIDVAYRYFATPRRRFVVADTPGHAQYTRNMVTAMSTADAAVILLDASRGITEQTRRHTVLTALLRVPHLLVCANKLDLVGYSEEAFRMLEAEFLAFCRRIGRADATVIPLVALHGDNVTAPSARMPWYRGTPLLRALEAVASEPATAVEGVRFPVQGVSHDRAGAGRPARAYTGRLAGGIIRPGDPVVVLPAGVRTRVRAVQTFDGPLAAAAPPASISLVLEDELDVGRGDLLCGLSQPATVGQTLDALLCWFAPTPLRPGGRYALKHTTRSARALVTALQYRLDVGTLARDREARTLGLNDIGRAILRTTTPLCYDPYERNRTTGSFILIDEATNETVAAGMIV